MKIFMKLVYQYMAIFFTFSPTSSHLHPLEVQNCASNSRLVEDEDDSVKSGLKGLIYLKFHPQLMFKHRHVFCSQYQWFDREMKQIKNDNNCDLQDKG